MGDSLYSLRDASSKDVLLTIWLSPFYLMKLFTRMEFSIYSSIRALIFYLTLL